MRGRSKYIDSSRNKDFWPYQRGWPLLRVVTKRGTAVVVVLVVIAAILRRILCKALAHHARAREFYKFEQI